MSIQMEQFVIKLKDKRKRTFFLELMKQLEFVEIVKPTGNTQKRRMITELVASFEEIKAHQKGKLKLKTLDQVLNEL